MKMRHLEHILLKLVLISRELTIQHLCKLIKLAENILVAINLSNSRVSGHSLEEMHLQHLEGLILASCSNDTVTSILLLLNSHGQLNEIDLSRSQFKGSGLEAFHAPQLKKLI